MNAWLDACVDKCLDEILYELELATSGSFLVQASCGHVRTHLLPPVLLKGSWEAVLETPSLTFPSTAQGSASLPKGTQLVMNRHQQGHRPPAEQRL